ncbi:hypothetical protein XELAEV_18000761mg [Xenopus laevis]|nr:hypothetical protein XELAEV_18000761mg [Xenopus laevis]
MTLPTAYIQNYMPTSRSSCNTNAPIIASDNKGPRYNIGIRNHWEKGILLCKAYTLIYRGTQIKYREREPLGEGNPIMQSLHSRHRYNTGRENHWEKGILLCKAYTLIYRGTQIKYRERETLGEGNPVVQSLHSNIQRDTDKIQREGTIGRWESCPAELAL